MSIELTETTCIAYSTNEEFDMYSSDESRQKLKSLSSDVSITKTPLSRTSNVHSSSNLDSQYFVFKEGWCLKESGSTFLGSKNWRRRVFRLNQFRGRVSLSYYKSSTDPTPAGIIPLDYSYIVRPVEVDVKGKLHCFAVGPLVDDGSVRTYFICCMDAIDRQEWMVAIEAAIEGSPTDALCRINTLRGMNMNKRKSPSVGNESMLELERQELTRRASILFDVKDPSTFDLPSPPIEKKLFFHKGEELDLKFFEHKITHNSHDLELSPLNECPNGDDIDLDESNLLSHSPLNSFTRSIEFHDYLYHSSAWRIEQWYAVKDLLLSFNWFSEDTMQDITMARSKFTKDSLAIFKVESNIAADPQIVHDYFTNASQLGGNLDYPFRNEIILETFNSEEPRAEVIQNIYSIPIPHISKRELVAIRYWIPHYLDNEGYSGMVLVQVNHASAPINSSHERILLGPSAVLFRPVLSVTGEMHTFCTILIQINVRKSLQRMFKTAYNSGVLKFGVRSAFAQMKQHIQTFVNVF